MCSVILFVNVFCEFVVSCLQPLELTVWWLAVYLGVCVSLNLFQIATFPTVFVWFSRTLAYVFYITIHKKTVEQIFEIFILKFLANFCNFALDLVSAAAAAAAVELSWQTRLPSVFRCFCSSHCCYNCSSFYQIYHLCRKFIQKL